MTSPDASLPSDSSLLRRLRAGSEDAATALYLRYAPRLRHLTTVNTSPQLARRVDADDIVQSVFRALFTGAGQGLYDVPDGEDLWKLLVVIALNKIRSAGVYHGAAKRDVRATAELERMGSEATADPDLDPDRAFLSLAVRDTLGRLTADERRVIELRMDGYEVAEVAERAGCSKRTVERLLGQARAKLKRFFDEDFAP